MTSAQQDRELLQQCITREEMKEEHCNPEEQAVQSLSALKRLFEN